MEKIKNAKAASIMENFDDSNIDDVIEFINKPIDKGSYQAYTMVQLNSPCRVKLSKGSYEKCADLLFD